MTASGEGSAEFAITVVVNVRRTACVIALVVCYLTMLCEEQSKQRLAGTKRSKDRFLITWRKSVLVCVQKQNSHKGKTTLSKLEHPLVPSIFQEIVRVGRMVPASRSQIRGRI